MEGPMTSRATSATLHLTSSPNYTITSFFQFPPKPPTSKQKFSVKHLKSHARRLPPVGIPRRDAALLSFLAALVPSILQPAPATALSIGISGPKDWLKEQKRKSARFLLAPIDASREILRAAYNLLTASESGYASEEFKEVQKLLRSAARDCVPQQRNPFVAFQAKTGVEVCTFQLIVKNASSLLDKKDPVKLEAEAMLNDLIRSFTSLNDIANDTDIQLASNRQKVVDALTGTISSLNKFEGGVKDCLEI